MVAQVAVRSPRFRWTWLVMPPLLISLVIFALPQLRFVQVSMFRDIGYGRMEPVLTLENYIRFFTDSLTMHSLALTVAFSAITSVMCLFVAFPAAYVLARAQSVWTSFLAALLLVSSFVTVVIKILGLNVLFNSEGIVNRTLLMLHIVTKPIWFLNSAVGVVIGLVHYTLALLILVLMSVFQTIPRRLEEAAEIHGATRKGVFRTVIIPLSLPGVIAGCLMIFNLCMGAFTSPALLGGGRILTLPVLIERTVRQDLDYPFGATMATVLLVSVLGLNGLVGYGIARLRRHRGIVL